MPCLVLGSLTADKYGMLSFGVLELGPGPSLAVFLSFLDPCIPGKKPGFFEYAPVFLFHPQQGPADAVAYCFGLAGQAAAVHIDLDVESAHALGQF